MPIAICEILERNYGGEDGTRTHDLLTASQALFNFSEIY